MLPLGDDLSLLLVALFLNVFPNCALQREFPKVQNSLQNPECYHPESAKRPLKLPIM